MDPRHIEWRVNGFRGRKTAAPENTPSHPRNAHGRSSTERLISTSGAAITM